MNSELEKLLETLPQKKLGRFADAKIRFSFLKISLKKKLNNSLSLSVWQQALVLGIILLLIMTGTGAYAYSSNDVTQQSLLYPVKKEIEAVEMKLTKTENDKAKLHAKLAARRLAEAKVLSANQTNNAALAQTLKSAAEELNSAQEKAESIPKESDHNSVDDALADVSKNNLSDLKNIAANLAVEEKNDEAIDNTAIAISKLSDLSQHNKETRSTSTAQQSKKDQKEKSKATSTESLQKIKNDVNAFKAKHADNKSNEKAEKIIKHLEKKIDDAEKSIKSGDRKNFDKIVETTEALTKTGDNFIKTEKPDKNDSEKSSQRQQEKSDRKQDRQDNKSDGNQKQQNDEKKSDSR